MFICWKRFPIGALLLVAVVASFLASTEARNAHLIAERRAFENGERMNVRGAVEGEAIDKVESQLLGALEILQNYREAPVVPKFTEKRKNKFEFIRFGKR